MTGHRVDSVLLLSCDNMVVTAFNSISVLGAICLSVLRVRCSAVQHFLLLDLRLEFKLSVRIDKLYILQTPFQQYYLDMFFYLSKLLRGSVANG